MLKRKKQIIAKVMATTMLASTLATAFTPEADAAELQTKASVSETSIAGNNRYQTAVAISQNYNSTSKHAVIVNGQKGIVDALSATPYASLKKAPILMTESDKLNADTKAQLSKLNIKTVDIVGGTGSVNDSVKAEIEAMGITVNRIWGKDKYATSLAVAKEIDKISDISKIAVTSGEGLADAVSVAAPAAQNKMPIILAHPTNGLDAATKEYIDSENISNSYVIGGTSSVSTATQNSLPGTKERLSGGAGTGRAETNAAVVKKFYTSSSYDNVYVAKSGQVNKADEIADALALGVLAASNQDPVILVGKSLGSTQKTLLEGKEVDKITTVGKGIPTASIDAIKETQNSTKTVTTVAELKTALSNARDGQTINFKPTATVNEDIILTTDKMITVNLDGTYSKNITVDMEESTLNLNGTVSGIVAIDIESGTANINANVNGKISVDAATKVAIKSGVTVKSLEVKSTAKNTTVENKGTITTLDVLATGVKVSGSGNITTLNPQGDTDTSGVTGTIGNIDTTKQVSQVIAQNGKELVIKFSKAVDKSSVIDTRLGVDYLNDDNISITTIGTVHAIDTINAKASLSENGMTLTITPENGEYFNGTYRLDLSGLRSNGNVLDSYSTTFKIEDKTPMTVTGLVYDQNTNEFEIQLSEPVDDNTGMVLRVNGTPISTTINGPTKTIRFTNNTVAVNTNATIYLAGLKDGAGNVMTSYTGTVKTTNSNLSVSSLTALSSNQLKLVFNKQLSSTSETNITNNQNITVSKKDGKVLTNINSNVSITKDGNDTSGKTYIITINSGLDKDSQVISVSIVKDAYTDIVGTKIAATTKDVTVTKDKTAPTYKSITVNSEKTAIEVTMSEAIQTIDKSKISIIVNGFEIPTRNISAALKTGTNNVISITTNDSSAWANGKLKAGTYKTRLNAGAVSDLSGNLNAGVSLDKVIVTADANTTVKDLGNITPVSGTTNAFIIAAPTGESFTYESLEKATFTLESENSKKINATTVKFNDRNNEQVYIEFGDEDTISVTGTALLEVKGLELESKTPLNGKIATVNVKDNTTPKLEKVTSTIDTTNKKVKLVLDFSENIKSLSGTDFAFVKNNLIIRKGSGSSEKVYNLGGDSGDDIATYSVEGDKITIIISTTNSTSNLLTEIFTAGATNVSVEVKSQSAIEDLNGVKAKNIKINSSRVATEIIK